MAAGNDANELAVIRGAIAGDDRAFDAVVSSYAPRLLWLIQMRLAPTLRARVSSDDVLQEVLLVATPYDAYIMEEDGSLASRIINGRVHVRS